MHSTYELSYYIWPAWHIEIKTSKDVDPTVNQTGKKNHTFEVPKINFFHLQIKIQDEELFLEYIHYICWSTLLKQTCTKVCRQIEIFVLSRPDDDQAVQTWNMTS